MSDIQISRPDKVRYERIRYNPGQVLIEYGVIATMLILVAAMTLNVLGFNLGAIFRALVCEFSSSDSCGNIFMDGFEDLDAWDIVRGKWKAKDGELCGGPGKGRIFTELDENDYVITVDSATLSKGKGYGVYFRTSNPEKVDGYNFQFDPGYKKGSFTLRKWVKGRELKPFAITKAPDFDWYGQDYTLQIRVIGNTYSVYIDGEQILQGTDDTYQSGGVGLRTWNKSEVCFDGISVDQPSQ